MDVDRSSTCCERGSRGLVGRHARKRRPRGPGEPAEEAVHEGEASEICDQGAFFVGGVPKVPDFGAPRNIIIGHMYVQFQIPSKRRKWPIILLHGGGLAGSNFDATPNGTEGWFSQAVRNNYATFVGDQPGRGRSGFDASVFNKARITGDLSLIPSNISEAACDQIWTSPSYFGHIIPAGSTILDGTMIRHGDPGDPDPSTPEPGPAHGVYSPLYPTPPVDNSIDGNIAARIGAIGAAPNPVNNKYLALNACKFHLPSMEVTLPASTCANCNPSTITPPTRGCQRRLQSWSSGSAAPSSSRTRRECPALHTVRNLKERGSLGLLKGLLLIEGGTVLEQAGVQPSDFDSIPMMLLSGDYRPMTRQTNYDAFAAINASPTRWRSVGRAETINLELTGYKGKWKGTTHMMMFGTNSDKVFNFILDWADKNIKNPIATTSCNTSSNHDDDDHHHDDDDEDHGKKDKHKNKN